MTMLVASLLILAALIGVVAAHRLEIRPRLWHMLGCVAGSVALWFTLFPPSRTQDFARDMLVVITSGATSAQFEELPRTTRIALPGIDERDGATAHDAVRVPDLASALREHANVRRLLIVGGGLPARDRDTVRGYDIDFRPAPLPRGLVELSAAIPVRAGARWHVTGRIEGVPKAHVQLRDPSDRVVDSAVADDRGDFALQTRAGPAGQALFTLRIVDEAQRTVESVPVALVVSGGDAARILLLAGSPDPDLKYLRRWARDAGLRMDSRMTLSKGVTMHEGEAVLDAASLAATDLLIVDERSWTTLTEAEQAIINTAVGSGMGMLLRVTGSLPPAVIAGWNALGISLHAVDAPREIKLDTVAQGDGSLRFHREPLNASAAGTVSLLDASDGMPLGVWRNHARGRVGVWWLKDSYQLQLSGDAAGYGTLWSSTVHTLARSRGHANVQLPAEMWVDERATICNIDDTAIVVTPERQHVRLLVDDHGSEHRGSDALTCAGFWPHNAGWYRLEVGDTQIPFRVREHAEAPGLARADATRATQLLATQGTPPNAVPSMIALREIPLPRWPFFITWLIVTGTLWWLEQRNRTKPY